MNTIHYRVNKIPNNLMESLVFLLKQLDRETFLHSMRVGEMLYKFGLFLNLPQYQIEQLHLIGYLHDIGKISVPSTILTKCDPLTDSERENIKKHGIIGYHLLLPYITNNEILNAIRYHHENLDGSGYEGLVDNQIDFNTRLVRIVDSFDCMINKRCYKSKMSVDNSLNELLSLSGTVYDSHLVNEFVNFIKI